MNMPVTGSGTIPVAAADPGHPVSVKGECIAALLAACAVFGDKLPEARMQHYDVEIGTHDGAWMVTFVPRLADGERPQRGGRTSLGRELSVWVSPKDDSVQRIAFAR